MTIIEHNYFDEDAIEYADDLIAQGYDAICFETEAGILEYAFLWDHQLKIAQSVPASEARAGSFDAQPTALRFGASR